MKKTIVILISFIMLFVLSVNASATITDLSIDAKTLNAVLDDFRAALKNGDSYLSLSKYNLNKDTAYYDLNRYFTMNISDIGAFKFGRINESYISFDFEKSGNTISGVRFSYDEKYVDEKGNFDSAALEKDKKLISERFRKALSVVKKGMTDLEKALVLYDYLLTITNYPDSIGAHGTEAYPAASYKAYGLLRDCFSTCMGYAKLYTILLNESGVPAVTVGSDTINHEWMMVRIDGEWYHCDPTWDDFYNDYGFTSYLCPNDDAYDNGAVSHEYFLKSDEEIIELDHPDWEVTFTANPDFIYETPVSGKSGAFDDKFFAYDNEDFLCFSPMNYINGNWYFTDFITYSVVRTKMDGEPEYLQLPDEDEKPMYSFAYGNDLYVSSEHAVYRLDTVSDKFEKLFDTMADFDQEEQENIYYRFSEMSIQYDELHLTTVRFPGYDEEDPGDNDSEIIFDTKVYPMSEVQTMTALPIDGSSVSTAQKEDGSDSSGSDAGVKKPSPTVIVKEGNEQAEKIRSQSYTYIFIGAGVLILAAAGVMAALIIHNKR